MRLTTASLQQCRCCSCSTETLGLRSPGQGSACAMRLAFVQKLLGTFTCTGWSVCYEVRVCAYTFW